VTPSDQLDLFRLISQFFWLICLVTTLINYQIARRRIGTRIDPSNTEEAIRYMRRFAVIGALPWGLMGARKVRELELLSTFGAPAGIPMSERLIKITAALGPPFLLLWVWLAASHNVPLPK
jgi:hypothetical protein